MLKDVFLMDKDKTQQNIAEIGVFKDNNDFTYIIKKTEKLVSAIYLFSNYLSDNEPIKFDLKKNGLEALTYSFSLPNKGFELGILKILSLLEVSFVGGLISEMNFRVLKAEFEAVITIVRGINKTGQDEGLVLAESFFQVDRQIKSPVFNEAFVTNYHKGHSGLSDRLSDRKAIENNRSSEIKLKDKSNRQEIILSLLRRNNQLSIKDFTVAIKDCSEKTIQRELATLVDKGQIRKEGAKRWSRYSLK
jgi:hypothetical protein